MDGSIDGIATVKVSTHYSSCIPTAIPIAAISTISKTNGPNCTLAEGAKECVIYGYEGAPIEPVGVQCKLFFCTKNYKTSISQNVMEEHILSTSPQPLLNGSEYPDHLDIYDIYLVADPCFIDDKSYNLSQLQQIRNENLEHIPYTRKILALT